MLDAGMMLVGVPQLLHRDTAPKDHLRRRPVLRAILRASDNIPTTDRPKRVYPTLEAALARFRFMPPQAPGHLFVADFIARRSLKRAPLEDGSGEGWAWMFDPAMWNKLDRSAMNALVIDGPPRGEVPIAHIYGELSPVVARRHEGRANPLPKDMVEIAIPDAKTLMLFDPDRRQVGSERVHDDACWFDRETLEAAAVAAVSGVTSDRWAWTVSRPLTIGEPLRSLGERTCALELIVTDAAASGFTVAVTGTSSWSAVG